MLYVHVHVHVYNIFYSVTLMRDSWMVNHWMEQDVTGQNYKNFVVKNCIVEKKLLQTCASTSREM